VTSSAQNWSPVDPESVTPNRIVPPTSAAPAACADAFRLQSSATLRVPGRGLDTNTENRLAAAFLHAGLRVYPQWEVESGLGQAYAYHADFAFLDPGRGICIDIELDGNKDDPDDQARMSRRDRWFSSHGWHVLRFHSWDCSRDPDACARSVRDYAAAPPRPASPPPPPPPRAPPPPPASPVHRWSEPADPPAPGSQPWRKWLSGIAFAATVALGLWLIRAAEPSPSTPPPMAAAKAAPAVQAPPTRPPPTSAPTAVPCAFVRGFGALVDRLGVNTAGRCLESERTNPSNGNSEQRTSRGMLVWLKDANVSAFTDGEMTWYGCFDRIEARQSSDPFPC
jgi:very-short-patch-repair endonuclease